MIFWTSFSSSDIGMQLCGLRRTRLKTQLEMIVLLLKMASHNSKLQENKSNELHQSAATFVVNQRLYRKKRLCRICA